MRTQQQLNRDMPRWRGGRLINPGTPRPWRPVIDGGIGSADDRVWQRIEPSALDWFDDESWISRARSILARESTGRAQEPQTP
jgi:hypothetical protein